jgi:hypothetical protein
MIVKIVKNSLQIIVYTINPSTSLQTYVVAINCGLELIEKFKVYKRKHC